MAAISGIVELKAIHYRSALAALERAKALCSKEGCTVHVIGRGLDCIITPETPSEKIRELAPNPFYI